MGQPEYPPIIDEMVEKWRARLIPEWGVKLMPNAMSPEAEGRDGDALGQAQSNTDEKVLKLWLNLEMIDDDETLEQTVIHEILHACFEQVTAPLESVLEDAVAPIGIRLVKSEVNCNLEQVIEQIVRTIAECQDGCRRGRVGRGNPGYGE